MWRWPRKEPFHVLKDKVREVKLEAEQHRDLSLRQHAARAARSYVGALGMVEIHLSLEPHIGTPIAARAEAEAVRLAKRDKGTAAAPSEPFERYLADVRGPPIGLG